jgi:hypothetical protein
MKKVIFLIVSGIFVLHALTAFPQSKPVRIAIVNQVDTLATHVYFDPLHNIENPKNIFNFGAYTVDDLTSRFSGSQIETIELEMPFWFPKMSYKNFVGKPTKKLKTWLTMLKQQQDIDYLIVILHKWNPDPDVNFGFLDGIHYGIVSYATTRHAITLFSFVGYYIFSTKDFREVHLNPNHDRYVITNVSAMNAMSFKELINLPDSYLNLCRDKLRNIADTRDTEIWRVMMKELGN